MKKDNVSIYVSCHKKIKKPLGGKSFLKYIEVGKTLHNNKRRGFGDDTGDNISSKNLNYNELTAQYWVWKNDRKSSIVGFCHYRRFFKNKRATNKKTFYQQLLKPNDIRKILVDYDIICHRIDLGKVTKDRIATNTSALRTKDIGVVRDIILSKHGTKDAKAFDAVMERDWNYLLNMFICNKELASNYSSWLFGILSELEKNIKMDELEGHEKRIFGLWGELLLSVFIEANKLKVYSSEIIFTGEPYSPYTRIKNKIHNYLSFIKRKLIKK